MASSRFSLRRFINRETDILFTLNFELEAPNSLEFLAFYLKTLKMMIQEDAKIG